MRNYVQPCRGLVVVLLGLLLVLAGCSKPEKKPFSPPPAKVKIGISMATMEGDGYAAFQKAVEKGKKEAKADVLWKNAHNDPMEQAVNVDELMKEKVKTIVLQAVDPEQARGLVKKATRKKIKVLALERMPLDVHLDGLITPDFTRAGQLQGELVAGKVPMGKVVVFTAPEEEPAARDLWTGFQAQTGKNPGLEVVRVILPAQAKAETAKGKVAEALARHPDARAAVAQSSSLSEALLDALKDLPEDRPLVTVGIGAGKKAAVALAQGKHTGEVDTRPEFMGDYVLKSAIQLAGDMTMDYDRLVKNDSSDIPARIIPVRMITGENLYLLEERWGKDIKKARREAEKAKAKEGQGGQSPGGAGQGSEAGEGSGEKSSGQGGSAKSGGKSPGSKKTKVKITTKEGKVMEIEVEGEIKKIETETPQSGEGQGGSAQGQGGGSEQGMGGQ